MSQTVFGRSERSCASRNNSRPRKPVWRRFFAVPMLLALITAACEPGDFPGRATTTTVQPAPPGTSDVDPGDDTGGSGGDGSSGDDPAGDDSADGDPAGDDPGIPTEDTPGIPSDGGDEPPAPSIPSPSDPADPTDSTPGVPGDNDEVPPIEEVPPIPYPTEPAPAPDAPDPSDTPDISSVPAWSSASTWPNGQVPADGANVSIPAGMKVRIDRDVKVSGMTVAGELYFDPSTSAQLTSSGNIALTGLLHMKPTSNAVRHVIEFSGFSNGGFVGGGMMPVASDVGLWANGPAQLILEGAPRRGWTNVVGSVSAGATQVTVNDATGWQVGDTVVLAPTARPGQDGVRSGDQTGGFHETTIAAINGNRVTFANGPARNHPEVAGQYTAELMNLTRNVEIRGTDAAQSHVFVHTNQKPHFVRWVALSHLGVGDVLGRYPLHFHHAGDSTSGSLIEGVVVRNGEHHAFVPHESNGITMLDLVAYEISGGAAYWWDPGDDTHDLHMQHVIAAAVRGSDGFLLGRGNDMVLEDAVAVGVQGGKTRAGFFWNNGSSGNWYAEDLVAHNNGVHGIRVWQNSYIPQITDGFVAYYNQRSGIDHGAYANRYIYRDVHLYGNLESGVTMHATSSSGTRIAFENIIIDTAGIGEQSPVMMAQASIPANDVAMFVDLEVRGAFNGPVFRFANPSRHQLRCVDCSFPSGSELVTFNSRAPADAFLEIVNGGNARRYNVSGDTAIQVPRLGDGIGLLVEYFANDDLTNLVHSTVLPATKDSWEIYGPVPNRGAPPLRTVTVSDGYSTRWSGQLEVPTGGEHTFYSEFGGGVRLWVGGQLVIDDWNNRGRSGTWPNGNGHNQASVNLAAGRHDIRIEVKARATANTGSHFFNMYWATPDVDREIIPSQQLFPASIPDHRPDPATPPL